MKHRHRSGLFRSFSLEVLNTFNLQSPSTNFLNPHELSRIKCCDSLRIFSCWTSSSSRHNSYQSIIKSIFCLSRKTKIIFRPLQWRLFISFFASSSLDTSRIPWIGFQTASQRPSARPSVTQSVGFYHRRPRAAHHANVKLKLDEMIFINVRGSWRR